MLSIKWKVDNTDGDDTTYTLEARRDGEANWRPIATGKAPLTATKWDWNTETYPDGWYKVRVTSSDAAANSPDRALDLELRLDAVRDRQHAPDRSTPSPSRIRRRPRSRPMRSARSPRWRYSVDDGPWQLGTTADGLFDDQTEDLRIDLPAGLSRGTHTLAIRVADAAGNVGSVSTTFVIK